MNQALHGSIGKLVRQARTLHIGAIRPRFFSFINPQTREASYLAEIGGGFALSGQAAEDFRKRLQTASDAELVQLTSETGEAHQ